MGTKVYVGYHKRSVVDGVWKPWVVTSYDGEKSNWQRFTTRQDRDNYATWLKELIAQQEAKHAK